MSEHRIVIMGAAGRDFHDFNVVYRDDPAVRVVAFTATQIPGIAGRRYPAGAGRTALSGRDPDRPEAELERLIRDEHVDEVVFAYSDVSHETVMHAASRALAAGADFSLLARPGRCSRAAGRCSRSGRSGPAAARARRAATWPACSRRRGLKVGGRPPSDALRRPRRPARPALRDLRRPRPPQDDDRGARGVRAAPRRRTGRLRRGRLRGDPAGRRGGGRRRPVGRRQQRPAVLPARPVRRRRRSAPARSRADLPPGRDEPADGRRDRPQQDRLGRASRRSTWSSANIAAVNPTAQVVLARSAVTVAVDITGLRVAVVEDGPTLTHGGMAYGAGIVAARRFGAGPDRRPDAVRRRLDRRRSSRPTRCTSRSSRRWATARARWPTSRRPSTRCRSTSSSRRPRST